MKWPSNSLRQSFHKKAHEKVENPRGMGVGEFWEFLIGLCRLVLQILTLFQTQKCHFPHLFSDLASKIHTWRRLTCAAGGIV